jgi:hypothetical protein
VILPLAHLLSAAVTLDGAFQTSAPFTQPTLSPASIYHKALLRLRSYPLPAYTVESTTWRITTYIDGVRGDTSKAKHRYAFRTSDRLENSSSGEESNGRLPQAWVTPSFFGPLAWSLQPAASQAKSIQLAPDVSDLKVIASVTATVKPDYLISMIGYEEVENHRTYHLKLEPRVDGDRHNLRDLWVDTTTFDIWKGHYASRYSTTGFGYMSPTEVTSVFAPIGRYWIAMSSMWSYTPAFGNVAYVYMTTLDKIAFPSTLPEWLFDQDEYNRHEKARDVDVIDEILNPTSPSPLPSQ